MSFILKIIRKIDYLKNRLHHIFFNNIITDHYKPQIFKGQSFESVKSEVKKRAYCLVNPYDKDKLIITLLNYSHECQKEIIEQADSICRNTFTLFGQYISCSTCINWHKDYVSGHQWPLDFYLDLKIINLKDNSDIKYAWELNRFFHSLKLGQAYWLTANEKYAHKFVELVLSWINHNPPQKGINWQCSMEIAVRAVNLMWAYFFFIDSQKLSKSFHIILYNLIQAHGKHIYHNLENKSPVNGNHYIANLVGLLYISTLFPMIKNSHKWQTFAVKELIKEMDNQVLSDGVNFEGSLFYHRLVTEMFFYALWLLIVTTGENNPQSIEGSQKKRGQALFSASFVDKLEKMCESILYYTRPDNCAPQIGDNDSGRLLPFGSFKHDIKSHKHMLALAGEFFNRDDFKVWARDYYHEAIWIFGSSIKIPIKTACALVSQGFNSAGIYVMRHNNDYLIIRCNTPGSLGKGSHSHNDSLSFELCSNGKTFIIDPGSYTYTGNPEMRNLFRSTAYHNTVVIDGKEQSNMNKTHMFRLYPCSQSKTLLWETQDDRDIFIGQITYEKSSIVHKRKVLFDKKQKKWRITDSFEGKGIHELIWYFHVSQDVQVSLKDKMIVFTHSDGYVLTLDIGNYELLKRNVIKGWYSLGYGEIGESSILEIYWLGEMPVEFEYCFLPLINKSEL